MGSAHVGVEGMLEPDASIFAHAKRFITEHDGAALPGDTGTSSGTGRAAWASMLTDAEIGVYLQRTRCAHLLDAEALSYLAWPSAQWADQYAYTVCDGLAVPPPRDLVVLGEKPADVLTGTLEDDAPTEARRRAVPPHVAEDAFRWALQHDPKTVLDGIRDAMNRGDVVAPTTGPGNCPRSATAFGWSRRSSSAHSSNPTRIYGPSRFCNTDSDVVVACVNLFGVLMGCRNSSRRSACGSRTLDQSMAVPSGCRTARDAAVDREDLGSDRCLSASALRDVIIKVERAEEFVLSDAQLTPHHESPPSIDVFQDIQRSARTATFSTESLPKQTLARMNLGVPVNVRHGHDPTSAW
jgi:hypothetical protein